MASLKDPLLTYSLCHGRSYSHDDSGFVDVKPGVVGTSIEE